MLAANSPRATHPVPGHLTTVRAPRHHAKKSHAAAGRGIGVTVLGGNTNAIDFHPSGAVARGRGSTAGPREEARRMTTSSVYEKLSSIGVTLLDAPGPKSTYEPFIRTGSFLYVSGHIAKRDG